MSSILPIESDFIQEITPTLNGLPKELKILIVEKIAEMDFEEDYSDEEEDEEDEEEDEEHDCSSHAPGEHHHHTSTTTTSKKVEQVHEHSAGGGCCSVEPEMPAMIAISLVNRAFASLAYPYLYKAIELDSCSNVDLATFIVDVLPRQAIHVEMISINLEDFGDYLNNDAETLLALDAVVAAVVKTERKASDTGLDFSIRQRQELVAHIITLVPNLNTIVITMDPNPITGEGEKAVLALKSVGDKIIDLTMDGSGTSFNSGYLSEFLKSFPNLLRLDIDFPSLDRTGESDLIKTISSLDKVTNLYIRSAEYVNEEFANAEWKSPIEVLALSECEDINFPSFVKLLSKFKSSLKSLDIDDVPHNSSEADNLKYLGKPLDLPLLSSLVIGTQHEGSFLQCFSNCPLVEFEICFCPSIVTLEWEQFITSHQSTLKVLRIQNDSNLTAAEIEGMELYCLVKGIECEIEEDDSDDEDDEDEEDDEGIYDSHGDEIEDWEDEDEESEEGDGFSDEEEV